MQSHPMRHLRQDHLDRLRGTRRQRHGRGRTLTAMHLPLTRTAESPDLTRLPEDRRAWSGRRTAVTAVLTPPLALGLITAGGGWAPAHALWTALVALAAVPAAATLATYLPPPGAQARRDPECSPCTATSAMTVAAAALLLAVAPHEPLMAAVALAATSVGLLQQLTSPGASCTAT